jgi:ankyrin repeat protein
MMFENCTKQARTFNKFGESILHLACRHGKTGIVEFLMFQAGSSPRVICDSGRTPMHDACWTATPNFECIRLVLKEVPDLLLIADKRGFTPLVYLPRDTWGEWSDFLERNRDILAPKYLQ